MRIAIVAAAFLLSACGTTATTSSPSADQDVALVNELAAVKGCEKVGAQLKSQSLLGGFAATGMAYNNALADLKAQAAERGANRLLMITSSNTMGGTNMIADAYRCP